MSQNANPRLQEARIIAPLNKGTVLARTTLEQRLFDKFGGYTRYNGEGMDADDFDQVQREPISIYDVAVPWSPLTLEATVNTLLYIAQEFGELGRQSNVYVRLPNGVVEIVDTTGDINGEATIERLRNQGKV